MAWLAYSKDEDERVFINTDRITAIKAEFTGSEYALTIIADGWVDIIPIPKEVFKIITTPGNRIWDGLLETVKQRDHIFNLDVILGFR